MVIARSELDQNFKNQFNISKVHDSFTGGQKQVYIITRLNNKCVLKVFKDYGLREIRELEIYEKYKHIVGIPKSISIEEYDKNTIVFEEFIEGDNLENISHNYNQDYNSIKKLICKIIQILTPIWADRIVHRDIKPSNIIISENGSPNIIDFGIARDLEGVSLTETGQFQPRTWKFGTPEQFSNNKKLISIRTDFFSLGILGYYLYYNTLPFGNTKTTVEKKYSENNLKYNTNKKCKLNNLFSTIFKYSPAERPNKPETLLELFE